MIKLSFIGDIALNGLFSREPENNQLRFSPIEKLIDKNSLVFANLEIPIKSGEETNEYKTFVHLADENTTKAALTQLNIGCVSLANNHIFDSKMDGVKKTIQVLDELGIYHTGAGWLDKHIEPVIIENGIEKIAFIAYVDKSTNPKTEQHPELKINYFDEEKIISEIKCLIGKVDRIICSIHWGVDYSNYFTKNQQQCAKRIIDSGVDIIMGHHSHTLQAFEQYKKGIIFYSLGQLCFGDFIWEGKQGSLRKKTKLGMIAKISNPDFSDLMLTPTIEKKFNYLISGKINLKKKIKRLKMVNELTFKYKSIALIVRFKEAFIDRIHNFLFGYYSSPLSKLTSLKSLNKVSFMFRDFKKMS